MNELEMKQYTTKKVVNACKMSRKEAEKLMGRNVYPDSEEREDEGGFLIVYPDGYKSWCPSHIFYQFYKPTGSYLDRMIVELGEVKERYLNGRDYTFSVDFRSLDMEQQNLLRKQLDAMESYLYILSKRISDAVERLSENAIDSKSENTTDSNEGKQ